MKGIVVDTNVLLSALLFRGAVNGVHAAWRAGALRLAASDAILAEYARALAYPKFGLDAERVTAILCDHVLPYTERVVVAPAERICRDPDDDAFVHAARASQAAALVTGDRDLLELRCDVRILSPRQLLEELSAAKVASE